MDFDQEIKKYQTKDTSHNQAKESRSASSPNASLVLAPKTLLHLVKTSKTKPVLIVYLFLLAKIIWLNVNVLTWSAPKVAYQFVDLRFEHMSIISTLISAVLIVSAIAVFLLKKRMIGVLIVFLIMNIFRYIYFGFGFEFLMMPVAELVVLILLSLSISKSM